MNDPRVHTDETAVEPAARCDIAVVVPAHDEARHIARVVATMPAILMFAAPLGRALLLLQRRALGEALLRSQAGSESRGCAWLSGAALSRESLYSTYEPATVISAPRLTR